VHLGLRDQGRKESKERKILTQKHGETEKSFRMKSLWKGLSSREGEEVSHNLWNAVKVHDESESGVGGT